MATARKVLPVPAGPMPKLMSWVAMSAGIIFAAASYRFLSSRSAARTASGAPLILNRLPRLAISTPTRSSTSRRCSSNGPHRLASRSLSSGSRGANVVEGEAGEGPQRKDVGKAWIERAQPVDRLRDDAQAERGVVFGQVEIGQFDASQVAAALVGLPFAQVVDHDLAHRKCREAEQMGAIVDPGLGFDQFDEGFMHQRGRVEGVVGLAATQLAGTLFQVVIDLLEQCKIRRTQRLAGVSHRGFP
jgi:hypothetical protein